MKSPRTIPFALFLALLWGASCRGQVFDDAEAELAALSQRVDQQASDMAVLQQEVQTLKTQVFGDISLLNQQVNTLKARVTALESATPAEPPTEPPAALIPHGTQPGGTPDWLTGDRLRSTLPPSGWRAAKPWLNVIYDPNQSGPATATVRSLRLKGIVSGKEVVLGEDDYVQTKHLCGGRWQRYRNDDPAQGLAWFWGGSANEPLIGLTYGAEGVTVDVTADKNRIWHTLMCNRVWLPNNLQRAWVEAEVKISGAAVVHVGLDWWRDLSVGYGGKNVNNTEASWSKWYYARNEVLTISVGAP